METAMGRARARSWNLVAAIAAAFIVPLFLGEPALSQDREAGPWWPHPIWGPDDQAGGSNWITPEVILRATQLVTTGKVYELGQIYEAGMPLFGQRTFALTIPGAPTGGPFGDNKLVYHDEFLCGEIGQVGTQFDGPGHIGTRMQMGDGTVQDVFYNGFTEDEIANAYGLKKLGIENIKSFITRGVLIDIAGLKGVDALDHSYEVTVADVRGALARQGMQESELQSGDALFFRYGWSKHWTDADKYNTDPPGIGLAGGTTAVDDRLRSMDDGGGAEPRSDAGLSRASGDHQQGGDLEPGEHGLRRSRRRWC